jgi:hypothetical protein
LEHDIRQHFAQEILLTLDVFWRKKTREVKSCGVFPAIAQHLGPVDQSKGRSVALSWPF